jgi:hypothetical protein
MGFEFVSDKSASPNIIVTLVMLGWVPFVLWLFTKFPARQAVIISFITSWLFLPVVELVLPGIPDYTKVSATSYSILLATFVFDVERFKRFRFGVLDIPMAIWCFCPLISSLSNGLGLYDGISESLSQTMTWGIPYFLGRIYLTDLVSLRQLAFGIFAGGLIYIPLCFYEIRMSPQLHRMLYGGFAHSFAQTIRFGGWRPTVFMSHGLEVAAWMVAALLVGVWLWYTKSVKTLFGIPLNISVPILFLTFILLRSTGAYLLFVLGLTMLMVGIVFRTALPVYICVIGIFSYLIVNSLTESYVSDQIIDFFSSFLPEDRLQSLEFRFDNEELLADKARQKILFGWGGWGRNRVYDDQGNDITTTDSLWIIAFGIRGILGLASLYSALLLPVVSVFWSKCQPRVWDSREMAPVAALAIALLLFSIDTLVNAMINPIFILTCGALSGYVMAPSRSKITRHQQRISLGSPSSSSINTIN